MLQVILTDEHGNTVGREEIVAAHKGKGKLHKAFSGFVFQDNRSKLLIQKRSKDKTLFPLLWANTCCSHPREGENIVLAGERRLQEECGFTCPLQVHSSFVYRAIDPEGKGVEHEYDTILIGDVEGEVAFLTDPNPHEVEEIKCINVAELQEDMRQSPEKYAPWFPIALKRILEE